MLSGRKVTCCHPGLVLSGRKVTCVPEFAPDFDPNPNPNPNSNPNPNPNALPPPDPHRIDITELGDEMIGGDGDDIIDNNPIRGPAQAIRDRRALERAALSYTESDALAGPRPLHACALFYTAADVAACLNFNTGLATPSAPFVLYVGSGARRPTEFGQFVEKFSNATVVHGDTRLGGYSHDLRLPAVAHAVKALAALSNCIGVLVSVPCDTWSTVKFNDEANAPQPLRDCDNLL